LTPRWLAHPDDARQPVDHPPHPAVVLSLIAGAGTFYFVLHDRAVQQAEEQARTPLATALATARLLA
jgi:hypothetical protein